MKVSGVPYEVNLSRTVTYPWMPKALNPNARVNKFLKNKMFQDYKLAVWQLTKVSNLELDQSKRILLDIMFYKPDKRRRDLDNCLSAFKAGLDGISLAVGIDDSKFKLAIDIADEIGGYVKVNFLYKE